MALFSREQQQALREARAAVDDAWAAVQRSHAAILDTKAAHGLDSGHHAAAWQAWLRASDAYEAAERRWLDLFIALIPATAWPERMEQGI